MIRENEHPSFLEQTGLLKPAESGNYASRIHPDTICVTFKCGKTAIISHKDLEELHNRREQRIQQGVKLGLPLAVLVNSNYVSLLREWLLEIHNREDQEQ